MMPSRSLLSESIQLANKFPNSRYSRAIRSTFTPQSLKPVRLASAHAVYSQKVESEGNRMMLRMGILKD